MELNSTTTSIMRTAASTHEKPPSTKISIASGTSINNRSEWAGFGSPPRDVRRGNRSPPKSRRNNNGLMLTSSNTCGGDGSKKRQKQVLDPNQSGSNDFAASRICAENQANVSDSRDTEKRPTRPKPVSPIMVSQSAIIPGKMPKKEKEILSETPPKVQLRTIPKITPEAQLKAPPDTIRETPLSDTILKTPESNIIKSSIQKEPDAEEKYLNKIQILQTKLDIKELEVQIKTKENLEKTHRIQYLSERLANGDSPKIEAYQTVILHLKRRATTAEDDNRNKDARLETQQELIEQLNAQLLKQQEEIAHMKEQVQSTSTEKKIVSSDDSVDSSRLQALKKRMSEHEAMLRDTVLRIGSLEQRGEILRIRGFAKNGEAVEDESSISGTLVSITERTDFHLDSRPESLRYVIEECEPPQRNSNNGKSGEKSLLEEDEMSLLEDAEASIKENESKMVQMQEALESEKAKRLEAERSLQALQKNGRVQSNRASNLSSASVSSARKPSNGRKKMMIPVQVKNKIDSLKLSVKEKENSLQAATKTIEETDAKVMKLKRSLDEITWSESAITREMEQLRNHEDDDATASLPMKIVSLENKFKEMQAKYFAAEEQVNSIEKDRQQKVILVELAQGNLKETEEKLEKMKILMHKANERKLDAEQKIRDCEERCKVNDIEEVPTKFLNMQKELLEKRVQLKNAEEEISNLQGETLVILQDAKGFASRAEKKAIASIEENDLLVEEFKKSLKQSEANQAEINKQLHDLVRLCKINDISEIPAKLALLEEESKSLKAELDKVEQDHKEEIHSGEINELRTALEDSNENLTNALGKMRALERECKVKSIDEIPTRFTELAKQNEEMHKQIVEMETAKATESSNIPALDGRLKEAENRNMDLKKSLVASEKHNRYLDSQLTSLKQTIGVEDVSQIPAKIADLEERLEQAKQDLVRTDEKLQMQVEADVARQEKSVELRNKLTGEISELKHALDEANAKLSGADKKLIWLEMKCQVDSVEEIPGKIAGFEKQVHSSVSLQSAEKVSANEDTAATHKLRAEVIELSKSLKEACSKQAEAEDKIVSLEKNCNVDDVNDIPAKIASLEKRVEMAESKAISSEDSYKTDLLDTVDALQKAESEILDLKDSIEFLNTKCCDVERKISHVETSCRVDDINLLPSRIAELEEQLSNARADLAWASELTDSHEEKKLACIPRMESSSSGENADAAALQRQLDEAARKESHATQRVLELEAELIRIKEELAMVQEMADSKTKDKKYQFQSQIIASLRRSLEEAQTTERRAEETIAHLEEDVANKDQEIGNKKAIVGALEDRSMAVANLQETLKRLRVEQFETDQQIEITVKACEVDDIKKVPAKIEMLKKEIEGKNEDIERLKSKLDNLEKGNGSDEAEDNFLREKLSDMEKELKMSRSILASAEDKIQELEANEKKNKTAERSLREKLNDMEKELELTKSDLENAEDKIQELSEKLEAMKKVKANSEFNENFLRERLSEVEEELEATKMDLHQTEDKIQELSHELETREKTLASLEATENFLRNQLSETESEMEKAKLDLMNKENRIHELETMKRRKAPRRHSIDNLYGSLSNLKYNADKETTQNLQEQLNSAETRARLLQGEVNNLKRTLEAAEAEVEELRRAETTGETSLESSINILSDDQPSFDLTDDIKQLKRLVEQKDREIDALKEEISDQQSQLTNARNMIESLEEERNYNRAKTSELSSLISKSDTSATEEALQEKAMECAGLLAERDSLKHKLQSWEALVQSLQHDNEVKKDLIQRLSAFGGADSSLDKFIESLQDEQERSLARAADLSIKLAESRSRVDELTKEVNDLKRKVNESEEKTKNGFHQSARSTMSRLGSFSILGRSVTSGGSEHSAFNASGFSSTRSSSQTNSLYNSDVDKSETEANLLSSDDSDTDSTDGMAEIVIV